ncbi:hypothetical protein AQ490_24040 [Wenjunlia vitaminophila]|uniref:Uncharacterized protein n=1 Tax=Wenjunlia vitaminophila TaxID=76728 RepID=A0A0T6LRI8_WENVI|nr:hypothetical protein [Wenjunlia vitaminophila]KRV48616.1 hypothetical protein AQ490_24040 [Wenjunlia vitaminophila]
MDVFRSSGDFDNTSIGRCVLPAGVPAGKRLVIETVTGHYYADGGVLGPAYMDANGVRYGFPWTQCGSLGHDTGDRRFYGFTHQVRLYVDGPATLQFDAYGAAGGTGQPSGGYSVTGYLEPLL